MLLKLYYQLVFCASPLFMTFYIYIYFSCLPLHLASCFFGVCVSVSLFFLSFCFIFSVRLQNAAAHLFQLVTLWQRTLPHGAAKRELNRHTQYTSEWVSKQAWVCVCVLVSVIICCCKSNECVCVCLRLFLFCACDSLRESGERESVVSAQKNEERVSLMWVTEWVEHTQLGIIMHTQKVNA